MAINNMYNLPFFDIGMYEKLSYDQLCRQLMRCKEPSMILAIIQDLLEYPNNSIFNDILVYDRISSCLHAATETIKKKALLVLYRCLIFIAEGNTFSMIECIFNDIIACGFCDCLEIRRISLQCLKMITSDLSLDQFVICIENACFEFLAANNNVLRQKLSQIIKEIFGKLPSHLDRTIILDAFDTRVQDKTDIVYQFLSNNLTTQGHTKGPATHCVLKADIFPKFVHEKLENSTLKCQNYKRNNIEDSLQLLESINHSRNHTINGTDNFYVSDTIHRTTDADHIHGDAQTKTGTNVSGQARRKFPDEFFQSSSVGKYQLESRHLRPQWWNDIYRNNLEKSDMQTESVPTYYLESVRRSASKRKNALLRTYNYIDEDPSNYSQSNIPFTMMDGLKKVAGTDKCVTPEPLGTRIVNKYMIKLPQLNETNKIKMDYTRTASFPSLKKGQLTNIKRTQTATIVSNNKSTSVNTEQIDSICGNIKSPDWEKNCEGLEEIQRLLTDGKSASFDSGTIRSICTSTYEAIKCPRSQVSRLGMETLNKIVEVIGSRLDLDSDRLAEIITKKTSDINRFIREDADIAMKNLLIYLSTDRAIESLVRVAFNNRNGNIRKIFAANIDWLCQHHMDLIKDKGKLVLKICELAEQMSKDANEETRHCGRAITNRLESYKDDLY